MALNLIGYVGLDGSAWESGLKRLGSSLKGLAVQAFGFYAVQAAIRKTIQTAGNLVDTSQRLGVSIEMLQILERAAKDAGSSLDAVANAFEKIDVAREEALSGTETGKKLMGRFAQLGVTPQDLRTKTAADIFTGGMAATSRRTAQPDLGPILRDIVGKGFGQIMPVLQTDFGELSDRMKRFGGLMSAETAVKLDYLGDQFEMLGTIITSHLGPAIVGFVQTMYAQGLKLGKGIASISAFYGAGTSGSGVLGSVGKMLGMAQIAQVDMWRRLFGGKESSEAFLTRWAERIGFKLTDAAEAATEAQEPWTKRLDELGDLIRRMEFEAAKLNKPKVPEYTPPERPVTQRQQTATADALVRVGNFLGSSGRVMAELTAVDRQVIAIQANTKATEANTRAVAAADKKSGSGFATSSWDMFPRGL